MKTINLNIDVGQKLMELGQDKYIVIVGWIAQMIARASNKPDCTGRATKMASMEEQRKYTKVIGILEAHKDGIVEIEDDDYNYLKRKYNQAEMPLTTDLSKLLVDIGLCIDKAKSK